MKRLFTAKAMQAADNAAIKSGIPAIKLMKIAGSQVARASSKQFPKANRVLVLCGRGNNGGDGYVVAKYLLDKGLDVDVLEPHPIPSSKESQTTRNEYLVKKKPKTLNKESLNKLIKKADLIIDALFGSGLSRPLSGELAELIDIVNKSNKKILSVDIPSGIIADRPEIIGPYINADYTVQLAGAKISSIFYPTKYAFGKQKVVNIGISKNILKEKSNIKLLDNKAVKSFLPKRANDSHKYDVGTVLVIAGSPKYQGAAELCSRAALRAGAGLVTLASQSQSANSWSEIIFRKLNPNKVFEGISNIEEKYASARVIGPGLDESITKHLPEIIEMSDRVTVLDASALLNDGNWGKAVREHGKCILTPHFGEAGLLLGRNSKEVANDPIVSAKELAKKYNSTVVLKSATTVIANAKEVFVSTAGHPGMATGGSGDVLAGAIAAFVAQTDDILKATAAAVYVHGKAGEASAKAFGNGLIASDLVNQFAKVWKSLELD